MLVRMIPTRLHAAARVKSCLDLQGSCTKASSSGCARIVGPPPGSGGGQGTNKGKLLAPHPGAQVSVKH